MVRIVVCLDCDTDDPAEAYAIVRRILNRDIGIEWESSDEWYDSEGEAISEKEISRIRLQVLENEVE